MTIRSRPVLDRKHRPRWQDELRTQQLTVVGFAVAIALALGIFGAAVWNGYWESHFRPVAAVEGSSFSTADLDVRQRIVGAETIAQITELQAQQTGGGRDQLLQQQIDALTTQLGSLQSVAAGSLLDGATLAARAEDYDVSVDDAAVEAEVLERMTLPERVNAQLILVDPLPEDADPDDEPTAEQMEAAEAQAAEAVEQLEGGAVFGTVAAEVSDDFSAATGGGLGWFQEDDSAYAEYFDALKDAEVGEIVGPVEVDRGFAVLELIERRERTTEDGLQGQLDTQGVSDEAYRAYVREELLLDAYRDHFDESVVVSPTAQRRVAQIFIAPVTGEVTAQQRARHVLVQPDPELEDQAEATDEQWDAALEEARDVLEQLSAEDPDWFAIAEEHSDDTGSGARGGDLGWSDPAASPYVEEFGAALADLEVGELSDPVRTDFGYHIIQKTGERESPAAQATELVETLREDPDAFGETARLVSEDPDTAQEDGELGWVAPYQLSRMHEEAVFALTEVGEISEPIDDGSGITIYKLLETSESRDIEDERLEEIRNAGFERWLDEEVRAPVDTWIDPQYSSATGAS